jgi:hypothetical protein
LSLQLHDVPDFFAAGSAVIAEKVDFMSRIYEGFDVARGGGKDGFFFEGTAEVCR